MIVGISFQTGSAMDNPTKASTKKSKESSVSDTLKKEKEQRKINKGDLAYILFRIHDASEFLDEKAKQVAELMAPFKPIKGGAKTISTLVLVAGDMGSTYKIKNETSFEEAIQKRTEAIENALDNLNKISSDESSLINKKIDEIKTPTGQKPSQRTKWIGTSPQTKINKILIKILEGDAKLVKMLATLLPKQKELLEKLKDERGRTAVKKVAQAEAERERKRTGTKEEQAEVEEEEAEPEYATEVSDD